MSLEEIIVKQSAKIEGLHSDRLLLLYENKILKDQINNVITKMTSMVDNVKCQDDDGSHSHTHSYSQGNGDVDESHVMMSLKDLDKSSNVRLSDVSNKSSSNKTDNNNNNKKNNYNLSIL